jgi:acyl-CoA synthetase (NDP forming)
MTAAKRPSLRPLFEPRSVVVIGASQDPSRIGGRTLSYLIKGGFAGRIVPVNANRSEVQGLAAFPSITAVPGEIETTIVALPAKHTVSAVRASAEKGAKACIVFSSGFSEAGVEGRAAEAELGRIARDSGMRVLGPNCLGLFAAHTGFYGSFSNTLDRALPERGSLSIVSQSGAFGTHLYYLARERGLGLRYWISTGNEADVQASEALSYVVEDPETKVVILYLEGARDGRALIEALEAARQARKPVIAMKVGRSQVGAAAAASHTAALAGGDMVYNAVFRECGAWRAQSAEEAVDLAYAASGGRFPPGNRLGVVTISGGGGILMADVASDYGLDLPPMPEAAQAELVARLPYCAPRNPVDMTAQAFNQMELFASNLDIVVEQGGYDAVAAFFTTVPGSAAIRPPLKAALRRLRHRHPDRLIVLSMLVPPELLRDYESEGFPIFEDANRTVRAIAGLRFFAEAFERKARAADNERVELPDIPTTSGEQEALRFLTTAGIPVVTTRLCADAKEAASAFAEIGGPVVLKISSPDIAHKSEVGGVMVGIRNEADLRREFEAIIARVREQNPTARIDGVLIAPMVSGHIEMIVGTEYDPVFGPVVIVGLGGIYAEIFRDTRLALAPVSREQALSMLRGLRGYPLLAGARGVPPKDVGALSDLIARVSEIAAAAGERIASLDINPVVVREAGQGCLVLDASLHASEVSRDAA